MKRNALNDLIKWNNDEYKKPLIVWGARQVGKTYLIKNLFAEEYYKDIYIYTDFQEDSDAYQKLKGLTNPKDIIEYLSLRYGKDIDSNTLLIFDEIQRNPSIIT